jgi:MFS transporter, DHA1 family, multidrug resistance protein
VLRPDSRGAAALLTGLVAIGPLSTDMYLPALPQMTRALSADVGTVQLTLSAFLAGFAVAQLVYGPMSDRFGRRPCLLAGMALFVVASIASALAPDIESLIAARFVQAVGACAGPVLGRAVIRDVHTPERGARMLAYIGSAMAVAPLIAPSIGGQLAVRFGWASVFVALSAIGVVLLVTAALLMPETNRRPDPEAMRPRRILERYRLLLLSPTYVAYTAANACVFGGLFAFISGSSFVFIDFLGVPTEWFGACFATAVAGYIVGTALTGRLVNGVGILPMLRAGAVVAGMGGAVLAGLAWGGVATIAAVLAPMFVYMIGMGIAMPTAMAGAIGPFPHMAGAASALLGFVQMTVAALVGFAVGQWDDGTQVPMTTATALMGIGVLIAAIVAARQQRRSEATTRPSEP